MGKQSERKTADYLCVFCDSYGYIMDVNRKVQIGLITVFAAALFVGLRKLPQDQCAFLHYQPSQITADGLEFCGDDAPTFLNLDKLSFPVTMELSMPETLKVGQKVFVALKLINVSGEVIEPHELAITHTEPLHIMVVDESLEDYHHIHPEPLGPTGEWGFDFTPYRAGRYRVFAEFVPTRTQQKVTGTAEFEVQPATSRPEKPTSALPVAQLNSLPTQLSSSTENSLTLKFGEPLTLQPVMGALGHMVAFDEDLHGYAHLHPKYTGKEKDAEPVLEFAFNTDKPGKYRLWAQVKVDGEERFLPFDVVVQ
ncbi:MAG: hypothetical protein ACQKBW_07710 [Puniceicoccales bacterium]